MPTRVKLTPFEVNQVSQIAAYKWQPLNPISKIFHRVTLPAVNLAEKVIPNAPV
jgi:hypothetical protein